ncbi:MAG: DUF4838 domain-containing protein [Acidobacteriota bacterium]
MDRRSFLTWSLMGGLTAPARALYGKSGGLATRGVVLTPSDLSLEDWPERAARAKLTTVALHESALAVISKFVLSEAGRRFLAGCRRLSLDVEYELHIMSDLLERRHFDSDPDLFRMDETGLRQRDWNLCVSSERALSLVAENAVAIARILKPTTNRYFFWGDDNRGWCRCPRCKGLSDSDQALIVENRIVRELRKTNAKASLAHLSYRGTLQPPTQVKPEDGVFMEFAPIERTFALRLRPLTDRRHRARKDVPSNGELMDLLDANLAVFPSSSAQILEYWLDASAFSRWTRPARQLPWDRDVLAADVAQYRQRGIPHITSFAVFLDAEYLRRYGEPPLSEYGAVLNSA